MKYIYETSSYKEFNITDKYKTITRNIYGSENVIIAASQYFISPADLVKQDPLFIIHDSKFFTSKEVDTEIVSRKLLPWSDLVIGKLSQVDDLKDVTLVSKKDFFKFKKALLLLQWNWSNDFLNYIYTYLKNRRSEARLLTNHGSIKIAIGETIALLKSVEKILSLLADSTAIDTETDNYFCLANEYVLEANNLLAKLAGGRAFLRANVVEMLWTFSLLNSVYFTRAESNGD